MDAHVVRQQNRHCPVQEGIPQAVLDGIMCGLGQETILTDTIKLYPV